MKSNLISSFSVFTSRKCYPTFYFIISTSWVVINTLSPSSPRWWAPSPPGQSQEGGSILWQHQQRDAETGPVWAKAGQCTISTLDLLSWIPFSFYICILIPIPFYSMRILFLFYDENRAYAFNKVKHENGRNHMWVNCLRNSKVIL